MSENIVEIHVKKEETKTFNKIQFLSFSDFGNYVVRILSQPKEMYVHYIPSSKAMIRCLEDECPICVNNKRLMLEYPDEYRKMAGWNSRQYRHYFNVLDRTMVKVCNGCQYENHVGVSGQFSPVCSKCGTFINEIEQVPSNKVKVMSVSDTNAALLAAYQNTVLDAEGNPVGLFNFDIMFMVLKGDGNKKTITPSPLAQNSDKVEVPADTLFDLDRAVINLKADEILNLLSGVSLKDIFAARAPKTDENLEKQVVATSAEVKDKINELFAE